MALATKKISYQALLPDHGVDGHHVGVRKKLQIKISVDKLGRSALIGNFVDVTEIHQLTFGRNSKTCREKKPQVKK